MIKKIFVFCLIILLTGCGVKTEYIESASFDSRTYLFFSENNFDVNSYYVEFWDRNISKNDDTKIIMAKSDDKIYYEIDGSNKQIVIQTDGVKYTLDPVMLTFFKEDILMLEDNSEGILPSDMQQLGTKGYEKGEEKVFDKTYYYEKYTDDNIETTYYFDGYDLVYVKREASLQTILFKFDFMDNEVPDNLFEIPSNYSEMTY